jgi:hypothetical protein
MAHDTFAGKRISQVYVSGDDSLEWAELNEAVYPGMAIYIDSNGKANLCKNTDGPPSGIVECPRDADMDTQIASGKIIGYYPTGNKTVVWAFYLHASPVVAIRPGEPLVPSGTDGKLMKFAYTNSAIATDTLNNKVGRARSVDACSLTNDHLIKVALGG